MHPAVRTVDELQSLERPLMLAAFGGGTGNSGASAIAYLVHHWDARPVAEIDPDLFFDFSMTRPIVRIENGERVLDWPEARFFVARPEGVEHDVVLFAGPEPNLRWKQYAQAVLDVARALGVEEMVLVNSFTGAAPHTRSIPIHLVGAPAQLAERFDVTKRTPRYQGPATLGMALVVMLREAGLRTATLNAIAPFYIGVDPNPYAVRALVQALDRALGSRTSTDEIDNRVREIEEHARDAMARSEQLRTLVQNLEQQFDDSAGELAPATPAPLEPLDPDAVDVLMQDVESFLRGQRDGREAGSESGHRPV
jgi:predicted ATP-grasp superfamily ATP-dependent carboligase